MKIQLIVAIAFLTSMVGISHGAKVLHWSGEMTAGVFDDTSGNGNIGSVAGTATNAPGLVSNAIYLDGGANTLVQNWGTAGLPTLAADTWSMNAYVKLDAPCPSWAQIYNFGSGSYDTKNRGLIGYDDPADIRFVTSSAGEDHLWTGVLWDTGVWQMFTVTCNGSDITIYRDGAPIGTEAYNAGGGSITLADGDQRAMVGRSGWGQRIKGLVDEFTIWDNPLNQTEIDVLAQALVPEPATMLLFGIGGLLLIRRKQA